MEIRDRRAGLDDPKEFGTTAFFPRKSIVRPELTEKDSPKRRRGCPAILRSRRLKRGLIRLIRQKSPAPNIPD
jgi:hypothetical protein